MKKELDVLIDGLDLDEQKKHCLRSRWLDQVLWMEGKAAETQFRYYALRITAIVGGVLVPALVGLNLSGSSFEGYATGLSVATFVLGLVVAISIAVEEFFHYGDRGRHYRQTVEMLKSEGWQFFQLSGRFAEYASHQKAFRSFVDRVEQIINADVKKFVSEVVVEKKKGTMRQAPGLELGPRPTAKARQVAPTRGGGTDKRRDVAAGAPK